MRGWQNLLILVIASLLSLAGAELASLLAGIPLASPRACPGEQKPRDSKNFVADEQTGWRMRPSREFVYPTEGQSFRYVSDAEGFRTRETLQLAGEVRRQILISGDSYAWGYGVDYADSFGGLLEQQLPATAVRNLAMPGFGLDQAWLGLRHQGLPGGADLAIVTIYPDDLERSLSAFRQAEGFAKPAFELREGKLVERGPGDCPDAVARFLERHSRLFALYRRLGQRVGRQMGGGSWWDLNAAILDAIRADAEAAGVPVLFVHIPYETWLPFPALADYMQRTGAPYLDLYEILGDRHTEFYYAKDGHLNAAGHNRLAELIEAWIQQHAAPW